MSVHICPACGQALTVRYGVKLQHKKAQIFDIIERHTNQDDGIKADRLAWYIYPDIPKPVARERLKAHIHQLNDVLESSDWSVVNRDGRYRLVRAEGA